MSDNNIDRTILNIDDAPENIEVLNEILTSDYLVKISLNEKRALKLARKVCRLDSPVIYDAGNKWQLGNRMR